MITRHVKVGEAKTHLARRLAAVDAGEDLVICRCAMPFARVIRIDGEGGHAAMTATLRREWAKQKPETTTEIQFWRHEGHSR